MKTLLSLTFLFVLSTSMFAQGTSDKVKELVGKAISTMDEGNTEEARDLLEEAKKLDPDNPLYDYEIAYSYNIDKNYKKVIKICKSLMKHEDQFPEVYQMMGNAYDYDGNPKKAIQTYEKGLEMFPNAGNLYLERGNMEMVKEEVNEALNYYVEGTLRDPMFASNYYWCAVLYLGSNNEYLGMIYGEIFMNLERNSKRTAEISTYLYDTYQSEITLEGDTSASVSFASNQMEIAVSGDDSEEAANDLLEQLLSASYGNMVYEMTLILSIVGETEINLASLDRIRTKFLSNYYNNEKHEKYPNALFEFQKTIEEAGHMRAYNYWVLSQGDKSGFSEWVEANKEEWEAFLDWFLPNSIELDESNRFEQP
jgi:tetratricopeptide (TPR) repeat protein